jgi:hypothetical protein
MGIACLDCGITLERRPSGRGRQKLRCQPCIAAQAHQRGERRCPLCAEPAAVNRTYCVEHVARRPRVGAAA